MKKNIKDFKMFLENRREDNIEEESSEYFGNIDDDTISNENYRKVIYTGSNMQLVLMSIPPGEEIGSEVHEDGDQFFRIESGSGKLVLDGEEFDFESDFGMTISAGKEHNVINTGEEDLKVYSIYSPPEHPKGTLHKTKDDDDHGHIHESFHDKNGKPIGVDHLHRPVSENISKEEAEQLFGEIDNEGFYEWFKGGYAEMFTNEINDPKFKDLVDNKDVEGLEDYINKIFKKYDIF